MVILRSLDFAISAQRRIDTAPERRSTARQRRVAKAHAGSRHRPYRVALVAALALLTGAARARAADTTQWNVTADLTLKEGYDDNVYIQNTGPTQANFFAASAAGHRAVPAQKASSVTTVVPKLSVAYLPADFLNVLAFYAPEFVYYSTATYGSFIGRNSENYIANRAVLNFNGKVGPVTYDLGNSFNYIYGNDLGPTVGRPGDIPAIGGIPLRDRRKAFLFRNSFKLTYPIGDFFIRPVCATAFWDFMTEQKASPTPNQWVYENYISRSDISGGFDLGYDVGAHTAVVLGYRYGVQDQGQLLGVDSPYDNSYNRLLPGVEGTPWSWLKLSVLVGPDFRDFYDTAALDKLKFNRKKVLVYVDATATIIPTASDTVTLFIRRFELPAFSSFSMYEDITYSILWKHKVNDAFAVGAGFQLYIGEWQLPVKRDDWIYTPSVSVAYTYQQLSADLAYSYDWARNMVAVIPGTQTAYANGREFNRNLLTLSAKWSF